MLKIVTRKVVANGDTPYMLIKSGVIGANPTKRTPIEIKFRE